MAIEWDKIRDGLPTLKEIPAELRAVARIRRLERGQVLYHRGTQPEMMLCVLSGELQLIRHTPNGSDIVLQRSRGGFVAEASLDATSYHCDVIAATDGQVLMFPRAAFQAALESDPTFNQAWIRLLAREVRRLRAESERRSLKSAAERILHYIESEGSDGEIALKQTRKSWAAELGIAHEVLYRTLRQLCERGDIVTEGNRISLQRSADK